MVFAQHVSKRSRRSHAIAIYIALLCSFKSIATAEKPHDQPKLPKKVFPTAGGLREHFNFSEYWRSMSLPDMEHLTSPTLQEFNHWKGEIWVRPVELVALSAISAIASLYIDAFSLYDVGSVILPHLASTMALRLLYLDAVQFYLRSKVPTEYRTQFPTSIFPRQLKLFRFQNGLAGQISHHKRYVGEMLVDNPALWAIAILGKATALSAAVAIIPPEFLESIPSTVKHISPKDLSLALVSMGHLLARQSGHYSIRAASSHLVKHSKTRLTNHLRSYR